MEFRCEKCGSPTESKIEGRTQGTYCTSSECNWSVVTTYFPEIYTDQTEHHVYLVNTNQNSLSQIKFVSKAMGCNFLEAKKHLNSERVLLTVSKTPKVLELHSLANQYQLKLKIEPYCRHLTNG
jgi:hypothetical protein